jgi:DNA-binding MarR family transcriptional regulator
MGPNKATILIKKAALEFDKNINAELEEYDLTHSQYRVMKYLYRNEGQGVRTVDLERFFSMSHPTTIGILQNLEKKGLVRYRENPDNPHSRFIEPTEAGYGMKPTLYAVGEKLENDLTSNLSEEERRELVRLLRKMMGLD